MKPKVIRCSSYNPSYVTTPQKRRTPGWRGTFSNPAFKSSAENRARPWSRSIYDWQSGMGCFGASVRVLTYVKFTHARYDYCDYPPFTSTTFDTNVGVGSTPCRSFLTTPSLCCFCMCCRSHALSSRGSDAALIHIGRSSTTLNQNGRFTYPIASPHASPRSRGSKSR